MTTALFNLLATFAVLLQLCSLAAYGQVMTGEDSTAGSVISISGKRPLVDALDKIQERLHSPVNFEEAPYESTNDVDSQTVSTIRGPIQQRFPRGGQFAFALGTGMLNSSSAVQTVLAAYGNASLSGIYNFVQKGSRIDVLPTDVQTSDGKFRAVTPVMSQIVTFPMARRSVVETLQLIVESASQSSGMRVLLMSAPFNSTDSVELKADHELASDLISDLGQKFAPLYFRLLYDPTDKTYYLNLRPVPALLGPPALRPSRRQIVRSSSTNNPFFNKGK